MFTHFNIKAKVIDVTPESVIYKIATGEYGEDVFDEMLEHGRSHEIERFLKKNPTFKVWVAVDDIDMTDELDHFVLCSRWAEGIKQTGIKEKIIKELKIQINGE
jgi:hypothetical protein